jgi:hypothetical protein
MSKCTIFYNLLARAGATVPTPDCVLTFAVIGLLIRELAIAVVNCPNP